MDKKELNPLERQFLMLKARRQLRITLSNICINHSLSANTVTKETDAKVGQIASCKLDVVPPLANAKDTGRTDKISQPLRRHLWVIKWDMLFLLSDRLSFVEHCSSFGRVTITVSDVIGGRPTNMTKQRWVAMRAMKRMSILAVSWLKMETSPLLRDAKTARNDV